MFPPGTTLGHEFSGIVVCVGRDVERYKIGDHVASLAVSGCGKCVACLSGTPMWCEKQSAPQQGGYAQFARVKEHASILLPKTVSITDGAMVEPFAVGLHSVAAAALPPGARVLVIGAGTIGLTTTYWCRQLGASKIAVMARSRRAAELCHLVGADALIERGEEVAARINVVLGGAPDIVFECAGMPTLIDDAIALVRPRGTVVVAGLCVTQDQITPGAALFKEVRIIFSLLYSVHEFEVAARKLDTGTINTDAMIVKTISLDKLPSTFEALRQSYPPCKVQIDPGA
jgi:threonine dehydrogenase-like Zn-dependent dehydrogenase